MEFGGQPPCEAELSSTKQIAPEQAVRLRAVAAAETVQTFSNQDGRADLQIFIVFGAKSKVGFARNTTQQAANPADYDRERITLEVDRPVIVAEQVFGDARAQQREVRAGIDQETGEPFVRPDRD